MTTIKILGAAAILAYALASPAMAQQVTSGNYQRPAFADQVNRQSGTWQNSYNRWDGRTGFGPGNAAAGTAAGTASAMAVESIGGEEYARRNGFVCIPGTLFRGEDGRRHICQ